MGKKLNFDNSMIQGLYWTLSCFGCGYVAVFMLAEGYSNTSIGVIIALGNLLSIGLQAVLSDLTDKSYKLNNINVSLMLLMVLLLLGAIMALIPGKGALMTIIYTLIIVVFTSMHPFINGITFSLSETGEYLNFGLARGTGSLFAGIINLVLGTLVLIMGTKVIILYAFPVIILLGAMMITAAKHRAQGMKARLEMGDTARSEEKIGRVISTREFIVRNKLFMIFSIGIAALFFGNAIVENFTIQIIESVGGNVAQMGYMMFFLCLLELPGMFFFDRLRKRFGFSLLLKISGVFFTLKLVIMWMASSMTLIYVAQLTQLAGYGIMLPGVVSLIDYLMSKEEAVRGQAVFTAAYTIGMVLGLVIGGVILDKFDPQALLLISSALSAIGMVVIWLTIGRLMKKA